MLYFLSLFIPYRLIFKKNEQSKFGTEKKCHPGNTIAAVSDANIYIGASKTIEHVFHKIGDETTKLKKK